MLFRSAAPAASTGSTQNALSTVFQLGPGTATSAGSIGFLGAAPVARPAQYTVTGTNVGTNSSWVPATRALGQVQLATTSGFAGVTGGDVATTAANFALNADLLTLVGQVRTIQGVLRQLIEDLGSTSGFGLVQHNP